MSRGASGNENHDGMPGERSFAEILAGIRAGSEQDIRLLATLCFDRLHTRCHRRLVRFQVFGIVDADDIINDILEHFISRVQHATLPRVADGEAFEKWVNIEIRQRTAKANRRYRTDRAHLHRNSNACIEASLTDIVDPVSDTGFVDGSDQLDHALASLPEELKSIARLYLAGCSQADIARQLGLSPKCVSRMLQEIYSIWRNAVS